MGLDTEILFRCKNAEPALEDPLLNGFKIVPIGRYMAEECLGATHEIDTGSRYYGPGYERGPWPKIAAVLMELLACEDVEKVWYGSDASTPQEIDADGVCEISRHYMANGQRPYRRR